MPAAFEERTGSWKGVSLGWVRPNRDGRGGLPSSGTSSGAGRVADGIDDMLRPGHEVGQCGWNQCGHCQALKKAKAY